MRSFNPNAPWKPGHVIMGRQITVVGPENYEAMLKELEDAGVNSAQMRAKLALSAKLAALAIKKMLASV